MDALKRRNKRAAEVVRARMGDKGKGIQFRVLEPRLVAPSKWDVVLRVTGTPPGVLEQFQQEVKKEMRRTR